MSSRAEYGFEFARGREGEGKGGVKGFSSRAKGKEGKGGVWVELSCEAKKKGKIYFVIYIAGFFF